MKQDHFAAWSVSEDCLLPQTSLDVKYTKGMNWKVRNRGDRYRNHSMLIAGVSSRLLLSTNAFSGAVLDEHGRFLDLNQSAADLFAAKREKLLGKTIFYWLASCDAAKFMSYIRQVFRSRNKTRLVVEIYIQSGDGFFRELRLECAGNGMPRTDGGGCLVTITDITDLQLEGQGYRLNG